MNRVKVSICMPTYQRPDLIGQCIESCLSQTHADIELLIGDDSKDDRTQALIEEKYAGDPRVVYIRNRPALRQCRNVAMLFERASGDKIVLMHDDDYLALDCVEKLLRVFDENPGVEVAFGDQYEVDDDSRVDFAESERLNASFYRTKEVEGLQPLGGRAGLIGMFPNNGWMANADLVKRVSYREQFVNGCDYAFGSELCLAAKGVYYTKQYVSYYRKTSESMSSTTRATLNSSSVIAYEFLTGLVLPRELYEARRLALRRFLPNVVSILARNKEPWKGLRLAFTGLHAYNYGFSARLYYHLLLIANAIVKGETKSHS
jgi:glycosyltransferase involved in cell wall biosynthesis